MKTKMFVMSLASLLLLVLGMFAPTAGAVSGPSWTSSGPINRSYHSAVLDPITNRMIIFGGYVGNNSVNRTLGNHYGLVNDVWRLNTVGSSSLSWTQVRASGTAPAPRAGHTAFYDAASNRMVIFGGAEGLASPCANDVWALTNANGTGGTPAWIQLSPAGTPPAARVLQAGAYDPNTNTMIIYGGENCFSTTFSDVWVLSNANGVSGTPTWTQLSPTGGGPGQRAWISDSAAYDAANNRFMLFGGSCPSGLCNDSWVLSNANGQGGTPAWTQLSPTGTLPPARNTNSTIYDPTTNRLTIFGGGGASGVLGDIWVLSNANGLGGTPAWSQIVSSSTDFAQARQLHTAVYTPLSNKMIIFGGQLTNADATNDVWVLNDANGQ